MQRRQLIKCLTAGALFSSLLPAFATEPVTLKVGASPLVTGDILEFVKPALAKKASISRSSNLPTISSRI